MPGAGSLVISIATSLTHGECTSPVFNQWTKLEPIFIIHVCYIYIYLKCGAARHIQLLVLAKGGSPVSRTKGLIICILTLSM